MNRHAPQLLTKRKFNRPMPPSNLTPNHQLLCQDYVLIQAWKKTVRFIRSHNWFSDILDLDLTEISLPRFLDRVAERLATPQAWQSDPIRMVPAPKSQPWKLSRKRKWKPKGKCRLRPLAHLTLRDQVAATAVMLCLADHVETAQGDPTLKVSLTTPSSERTISYGNRLFCDSTKYTNQLRHRWGSAALYRAYFHDYKNFISRPTTIADELAKDAKSQIYIIHADLEAFYDRISPTLLYASIEQQLPSNCDDNFRTLVKNLFAWKWHKHDTLLARQYEEENGIKSFQTIALPQGLVSAGFFSNLLMLGVDNSIRNSIDQEISENITLVDACRYVDDFRFVISTDTRESKACDIKNSVVTWLGGKLDDFESSLTAPHGSFSVSEEKCNVINVATRDNNVVHQSNRMNQIQQGISGGFDAIQGTDILTAIKALISSQRQLETMNQERQTWAWPLIPDTNDGTVKRFAAGRYRKTYRSVRPLLENLADSDPDNLSTAALPTYQNHKSTNERKELDHDAKVFAYSIIDDWANDASNVRLLRIALDLWPSPQLLERVLELLRTLTATVDDANQIANTSRVAWYCIAELFRAAPFETGCVDDKESLPEESDLHGYRIMLYEESVRISRSTAATAIPWYVRESILFFLASYGEWSGDHHRNLIAASTQHYKDLFGLLNGEHSEPLKVDLVKYLVLIRRCFPRHIDTICSPLEKTIDHGCIRALVAYDPSYAIEVIEKHPEMYSFIKNTHAVHDLCLGSVDSPETTEFISISEIVQQAPMHPLLNELSLLQFSVQFLRTLDNHKLYEQIRPTEVFVRISKSSGTIEKVTIKLSEHDDSSIESFYRPPNWCNAASRWRFHLGFLLRFLVTCSPDFTRHGMHRYTRSQVSRMYRSPSSHWYQRIHGMHNAQVALGDDWLPISRWFESLLYRLLAWPGVETSGASSNMDESVIPTRAGGVAALKDRLRCLKRLRGKSTRVLVLPMNAPFPYGRSTLHACIVQTGFPTVEDLKEDNRLARPKSRRIHRNHLAAALSTVQKMLYWRDLHLEEPRGLDLLVLPELAVNSLDVKSHLKPFALKHRSIIVAGVTYRQLDRSTDEQLVNSAVWVIPFQSVRGGWDILTRSQGKANIAPDEESWFKGRVAGFRPCQWLFEYSHPSNDEDESLNLTASICYDATDLALAADLRNLSDVFIVPALNKDVETFDNLAMHLHHNMFQMIVIANSAQYGGSCVWWPRKVTHERRVFHCHGQAQCSIGFFDIDVDEFLRRRESLGSGVWKSPPAGVI